MKKLTLVLTLAVAAFAAFAAPEKFLGWGCKDAGAMKAQLAKDNDSVPKYHKVYYVYLLAKLEAPESVDTLAKCEKLIDAAREKYGYAWNTREIILAIMYITKDNQFIDEFTKNPKYNETGYYRRYYVLGGRVKASDSERRDIAFEFAEKRIKAGKAVDAATMIDKYVEFSLDDDDAVVVKGLQKLYRLAAPKLTAASNDPWKPVVAKLQLALKSRGAEVK